MFADVSEIKIFSILVVSFFVSTAPRIYIRRSVALIMHRRLILSRRLSCEQSTIQRYYPRPFIFYPNPFRCVQFHPYMRMPPSLAYNFVQNLNDCICLPLFNCSSVKFRGLYFASFGPSVGNLSSSIRS